MTRLSSPALAVLLLLAGCSSYREPTIDVQSAMVLDRTDEAILLGFEIELANPNEEPMDLLNFDYQLHVDGRRVFQGRRAALVSLNRGTSRIVRLPAVVPFDKARWTDGQLPGSFRYYLGGTLHYVAPGEIAEILLDTGLKRPRALFAARGDVEVVASESAPAEPDVEPTPDSASE